MTRSKRFFIFCSIFIFGVLVGSYFSFEVWKLSLIAGFLIPLILLYKKNKFVTLLLVASVIFIIGIMRIEASKLDRSELLDIFKVNKIKTSLTGLVSMNPEIKKGHQILILKDVAFWDSKKTVNGNMNVYVDRYPEYSLGDFLKVDGKVLVPEDFEGFGYQNYLFSQGIYHSMYYPKVEILQKSEDGGIFKKFARIQKDANEKIKSVLPQPHGGIVSAMTVGIESDISDEVLLNFNKTGTRHVISISGLHMTIICIILMFLLLSIGLNRDYAFYFSMIGILIYVLIVGYPPCAVRSVIMSGMVLIAVKVGRLANSTNAIMFAAVLMLLYDPNLLRNDIGFQLSFLAVLGIIEIFPKINSYFEKYPDILNIRSVLLITISAQIATFPILINNFGYFSLMSILANILILPFVSMIMIGGFLIMIFASTSLFIAKLISLPVWLALSYQLAVIDFLSGLSFASFNLDEFGSFFTALYYVCLFIILKYDKFRFLGRIRRRIVN